MVARYKKYQYLTISYCLSKISSEYNLNDIRLTSIVVTAGHFKPAGLYPEHSLLFSSLIGKSPLLKTYVHGKRLRRTVTLVSNLSYNKSILFVDKFVNEILPASVDFTAFYFKPSVKIKNLTCHFKYYFELDELAGLISERLFKKDIFIPLCLQFVFSDNVGSLLQQELCLRIMRLPFMFYKTTIRSN